MAEVHRFISFITRPEFIQDVATGSFEIKMSDGSKETIPKLIENFGAKPLIEKFKEYCKDNDFEGLADSTAYNILTMCKYSIRRNSTDLDSCTAEGLEAFENLQSMLVTLKEMELMEEESSKSLTNHLIHGGTYLMSTYKNQIGYQLTTADHCINYSLGKDCNNSCDRAHEANCDNCNDLQDTLQAVYLAKRMLICIKQ